MRWMTWRAISAGPYVEEFEFGESLERYDIFEWDGTETSQGVVVQVETRVEGAGLVSVL